MGRRGQLLLLISFAGLTGCVGGSYSPSYFPFYLPPGDIIQTHAKPPGRGYFSNFDPKAVRLELKPDQVSNPTRTHQLLVASVYDKDGDRRRKRRVEWILDGPGYIVEVDESGFAAGRGYLIDNKRAVSYTDLFERTIKRGNDDPRDDFTIMPGQTWCIVSCAVEGQTTVTAYAPAIFDRDKSTVTAKLVWSDAQFQFPTPQLSRSGGEVELRTTLHRFEGQNHADGLKVRYRVLDGAPASLVAQGASTEAYSSSGGQRETEIEADDDGHAAVRLVQPMAQAGKTRIAVEVIKPDGNAGTVVDRRETTVEWATAQLSVDTQLPKVVALERETPITVTVRNTGKSESQPVTLRATLPEGAEYLRAEPAPTVLQGSQLTWMLGPLEGGQKVPVSIIVKPFRRGNLSVSALAETADGLRSEQRAFAGVGQASLRVLVEAPETIGPNDRFTSAVLITNSGSVPIENVTAWLSSDAAIEHPSGSQSELVFGTLSPGQSQRLEVPLTARTPGRYPLRATVTADGGLREQAEVMAVVRRSAYTLTISGPDRLTIGQAGTYEVRLGNIGETPLEAGAILRLEAPQGAQLRDPSAATAPPTDRLEWQLPAVAPGASSVFPVTIVGDRARPQFRLQAQLQPNGGGRPLRAERSLTVVGEPTVTLELAEESALVAVGQRTGLRVTVRNRGQGPAKNVGVVLSGRPEFRFRNGVGPDRQPAKLVGDRLEFPVLPELAAGTSAVFQVEVEGLQAGSTRIRAEVRAEHLRQPLREDQPFRVR